MKNKEMTRLGDKMVGYIMDRRTVDDSMYELDKILGCFNMEVYGKMCSGRIVDEAGIDFRDIMINPDNLHILLSYRGIERCKSILSSFLNDEQLETVVQTAREHQAYILSQNNLLWLFRSRSRGQLSEMQAEAVSHGIEDEQIYINAEIRSRRLPNKMRIILKESLSDLCVCLKYQGLLRSIKKSVRNLNAKKKRGEISVASSDRPAIIQKNFRKYQKMYKYRKDKNVLKRLVYYGILSYENNSRETVDGLMSCSQIEKEYSDMSNIIQAAAELTPQEFLTVFSITKEYDGNRYGTKDYFYTAEALKTFDMDRKIGERIIEFFEEFYGTHVFEFWFNYFSCINDYSVHCGIKEPADSYFKTIMGYKHGCRTGITRKGGI